MIWKPFVKSVIVDGWGNVAVAGVPSSSLLSVIVFLRPKIPSSKHQVPENIQMPITKTAARSV